MNHDKAESDRLDQEAAEQASQERGRTRLMALHHSSMPEDVTEDVVTILDAVSNSMDWGSGFLNREDLIAWKNLAQILGFHPAMIEGVDQQLRTRED